MLEGRGYELDELDYCAQELAFRSYADICGYAPDIEDIVMKDLEDLVNDPGRNRFVDYKRDVYVIEWANQDLFWNYDEEDERTLIEVDLEPIMDVYYGSPHFEISGGHMELVDFVKIDEQPSGYETECDYVWSYWSNYYISSFEAALEQQRPRFINDVKGYYCFTHDGYYNMDYLQAEDVMKLIKKHGEDCYYWDFDDKQWALDVMGYCSPCDDADGIFDDMLDTFLSGVSFEHILAK